MTVSGATQEVIYLRVLLKDLGYEQKKPTLIYQDNQGSVAMLKNAVVSRRTKHIDIRYHYIKDMIKTNQIRLDYIPTDKMITDCFTKIVWKNIINYAKDKIFGRKF